MTEIEKSEVTFTLIKKDSLFYLKDNYLDTIHTILNVKFQNNKERYNSNMVQQIKDTANMLVKLLNRENEQQRNARHEYWSGIDLFNYNIFTAKQFDTIIVKLKY